MDNKKKIKGNLFLLGLIFVVGHGQKVSQRCILSCIAYT